MLNLDAFGRSEAYLLAEPNLSVNSTYREKIERLADVTDLKAMLLVHRPLRRH